jgi:hypothetical protein
MHHLQWRVCFMPDHSYYLVSIQKQTYYTKSSQYFSTHGLHWITHDTFSYTEKQDLTSVYLHKDIIFFSLFDADDVFNFTSIWKHIKF